MCSSDLLTPKQARLRAIELLAATGIPAPEARVDQYPHQFSGGMRQRVMIAMALSTRPHLLLCDEPTSALDVTVQEQIVHLLADLRERHDLTIVFVTHDLAVASQLCDSVAVMYAGQVIEFGPLAEVFASPNHPYTKALMDAIPQIGTVGDLATIPGQPPTPDRYPVGCRFAPRCTRATAACAEYRYVAPTPSQPAACRLPLSGAVQP